MLCVCMCVRWEGGRKGEGEKSRVRKAGRMEGEEEDSGKRTTSIWYEVCYSLFSMVGSYESTNWFSTNWIAREDFPARVKYCT